MAVGLDCGTMNLVSAAGNARGGTDFRRVRDMYVRVPKAHMRMLKLRGVPFVDDDDEILVLGDAALELSNLMNVDPLRPLSKGMITPGSTEGMRALGVLIREVLPADGEPGSPCYFSVPAQPIDSKMDGVFHRGVLSKIISECGYAPTPSTEAMALIFSECAKQDFSGVALSFGSGMVNYAVAQAGVPVAEFSISRGGDWIDEGVARSTGSSVAAVCSLKESGAFDIAAPQGDTEEALAFYYRELIEGAVIALQNQCRGLKANFTSPLNVVLSGGTARAKGFTDAFRAALTPRAGRLPFALGDISLSSDPMNAVASGLLVQASL